MCLFLGFFAARTRPKSKRALQTSSPKISHAKPWAAQKTSTEFENFFQNCSYFEHRFNCISYAIAYWKSTRAATDSYAWIFHVFHAVPSHVELCKWLYAHTLTNSILDLAAVGQRTGTHRPTYFSCRYYSLDWRARSNVDWENADCRMPPSGERRAPKTAARSMRQHRRPKSISVHSGSSIRNVCSARQILKHLHTLRLADRIVVNAQFQVVLYPEPIENAWGYNVFVQMYVTARKKHLRLREIYIYSGHACPSVCLSVCKNT